ncbi:hypothetical protein CYMTET_40351 [Cymbomonas tetramitiformis]|uniref:Tudor domain-containing protein n=1 Tax=Cymbomonas tetramitiformis TaxID=36881 RepID=A0AAE0F3Q5_9CHLO|nr:hypothetical protein CYMTET_40351 [Cymbomonas tetramitiformis]
MVGLGVVVETASDEQVERSKDLEVSDESEDLGAVTPVLRSVERCSVRRDLFTRSRLGGSELQGPSTWDAMMFFIQASPCAAQLKSSFATAPTPEVTVGTRLEVFWEDDAKFYPGVVKSFNEDGAAHVVYDDGDEETLNLSEEKFNILLGNGASEQNSERGGGYEKNKRGGDTQNFFVCSLCGRSKDELGQSDITDLPILMQPRSLLDSTLSKYGPKAERDLCSSVYDSSNSVVVLGLFA